MKYFQTFDTLEQAKQYKKHVLAEKSTIPHTYILRINNTGEVLKFIDTEWQLPEKLVVFEYETESLFTKKLIDLLAKNKMFGPKHDYKDLNVYEEDIQHLTSLHNLLSGSIDNETMQIKMANNCINDLTCVEKLSALQDISGIDANGNYQNFFASEIVKINLPLTLKTIGNSAFAFCTQLTNITINYGVRNIEQRAFFNCTMLTELELPESVEKLGSLLFANSNVMKIIMNSEEPPVIEKNTFKNMKRNFIVYVPEESFEKYIDKWSIIANHIETQQN